MCTLGSPTDYRELFNLRHSSARNVVERTLGVLKRRFKMFQERTEYSLETQARIIPALCAIHNFILTFDVEDVLDSSNSALTEYVTASQVWTGGVSSVERERAAERRDTIAKAMWEKYQRLPSNLPIVY